MVKLLRAEIYKLKRRRLFRLSALTILALPLLVTLKDLFWNIRVVELGLDSWLASMQLMLGFIVLPVLSGFMMTELMQNEYSERAIINCVPALIHRRKLIWAKWMIWLLCHGCLVMLLSMMTLMCSLLLFPAGIVDRIQLVGWAYLQGGVLGFLSLSPIIAVSVIQRKVFYPSILATLFCTVVGAGMIQADGNLPLLTPWSSAFILSQSIVAWPLSVVGYASIVTIFVISMLVTFYHFERQDL